jgi:hypothetical protein
MAMKNMTIQEYLNTLVIEEADKARQLAEAQRQLEELRLEIHGIKKRLGMLEKPQPAVTSDAALNGSVNLRGMSRPKAAPIIIEREKRWLTMQDIVSHMEHGGIPMESKTSKVSMYKMLGLHPQLQSGIDARGRKVFGLNTWEAPPEIKLQPKAKPAKMRRGLKRHGTVRRSSGRDKLSIGDASEQVLRDTKPLHANGILARLQAMGINTNKRSLLDKLRRDSRKRFKNQGQNIWTLSEGGNEKMNSDLQKSA